MPALRLKVLCHLRTYLTHRLRELTQLARKNTPNGNVYLRGRPLCLRTSLRIAYASLRTPRFRVTAFLRGGQLHLRKSLRIAYASLRTPRFLQVGLPSFTTTYHSTKQSPSTPVCALTCFGQSPVAHSTSTLSPHCIRVPGVPLSLLVHWFVQLQELFCDRCSTFFSTLLLTLLLAIMSSFAHSSLQGGGKGVGGENYFPLTRRLRGAYAQLTHKIRDFLKTQRGSKKHGKFP